MNAKIIQFPGEHRPLSYTLSLYSDDEILLTIIAVNSFGTLPFKVSELNLVDIDPIYVISCLEKAKKSELLSSKGLTLIDNILRSVEQTFMDKSP